MATTRRGFLLGAMLLMAGVRAAPVARAAEETPERFLRAIYARYLGGAKQALGVPLDTERNLRRYFTPALASLIIKDRKAAALRHEPPALDGDPFVDAQDWQISALEIALERKAPLQALATVDFRNFDKPVSLRLELVHAKDGWRIDDIRWPEGSLRALLAGQ